jgi:hypothetical protein
MITDTHGLASGGCEAVNIFMWGSGIGYDSAISLLIDYFALYFNAI